MTKIMVAVIITVISTRVVVAFRCLSVGVEMRGMFKKSGANEPIIFVRLLKVEH